MIRVKIYDLPNFPPPLRTREDPKKYINISKIRIFEKKIITFETQGGLGGLSRGVRSCLLPVPSSAPFLPWPWVHDSRVTRELSHVTRSLSLSPSPHVPPSPTNTSVHWRRVRTREIVLRCRTVPCSGVARLQRCPLPLEPARLFPR